MRVIVVAAYGAVRAGLDTLLSEAADITVVAALSGAGDLTAAFAAAAPQPDAVLVDCASADVADVLASVDGYDLGVVLLGDAPEGYRQLLNVTVRGWGYLLRDVEGADIAAALRAAASGLVALDRSIAPQLALDAMHAPAAPIDAAPPGSADLLTAREREVLQLMAAGLANKMIAARLSISLHTVKFHVAAILARLGASSRTEAVTTGARLGLVAL